MCRRSHPAWSSFGWGRWSRSHALSNCLTHESLLCHFAQIWDQYRWVVKVGATLSIWSWRATPDFHLSCRACSGRLEGAVWEWCHCLSRSLSGHWGTRSGRSTQSILRCRSSLSLKVIHFLENTLSFHLDVTDLRHLNGNSPPWIVRALLGEMKNLQRLSG